MNRYRKSFVALVLAISFVTSGWTVGAYAQDAGLSKVGIVNRKQVYDQYKRQQDELARLKKELDVEKAKLDERETKLKDDRKAFDAQKETMPEAQMQAERDRLVSEYNKLVADGKSAQDKLDSRSQAVVASLRDDINGIVKEIGARENYDIILEGDPLASSVLYFKTPLDLSTRVVEELNSRYASGAKPAGAAAAAPAPEKSEKEPKKKK